MSDVQYLYRVCLPSHVNPAWESLPVPGGSNRFAGYWTPHAECARAIYATRLEYCEIEFASSTYAEIYRIRADQVRVGSGGRKSGHDDEFDRDEIFVVEVLGEPEVVTKSLVEAPCSCGGTAYYSHGRWYCPSCRRSGTACAIKRRD